MAVGSKPQRIGGAMVLTDERVYLYKGDLYPDYLKRGNANKFIEPFAKELCKGNGLDVGGVGDWVFPGARAINITSDDEWNAYNLPDGKYDYIFSSHTLEHLPDYVKAIICWQEHLTDDGVLFLYLPHPDMEYWLPQNDRKHLHSFRPEEMHKLLENLGFKCVFHSERDLYWSFTVVGIGLKVK